MGTIIFGNSVDAFLCGHLEQDTVEKLEKQEPRAMPIVI
jgi:hypothetical protein